MLPELTFMQRALELAARGEGYVEPNPMVGCVIVTDGAIAGEGWHQRFGGPHAEIEALQMAGTSARGATLYVTLEPCCHFGKTPPCTDSILAAGIRKVVVGLVDPFSDVQGKGIERLRQAGVEVEVGMLAEKIAELSAPYLKRILHRRPWVIAKWAMTLDGKLASRTGDSRWISNERSRSVVHQLRGRMDGILIGQRTAERDDPMLTARPSGARLATRMVLDSAATLSPSSQLVLSAREFPVMVVAGQEVPAENRKRLERAGCEVLALTGATWRERLPQLLDELGQREMTNVLVEGGAVTLGGFYDAGLIDEVRVFVAPKILGGADAPAPLAGHGAATLAESLALVHPRVEMLDGDVVISGRIRPAIAYQTNRSPDPPTPG